MEMPGPVMAKVRARGWSAELIERVVQSIARPDQIENLASSTLSEAKINGWLDFLERDPENPFVQAPLNILRTRSETGMHATPGPEGLRIADINIGSYGEVPDRWQYENDVPRGAHPAPGQYIPASYTIFDKSEIWADNVADLYEDAIRDRWVSATDLNWAEDLSELPEELERAVGQICTVYSNNGLLEQKVIARWLESISYGYYEVKSFLGTQIYDVGRKVEVLRKRALSNGGGLGQAPLGMHYKGWYGALKFTEMIIAIDVIYKSYEVSTFEWAEELAQTPLEEKMWAYLARDSKRHLAYGLRHMRWYMDHHDRADEVLPIFVGRQEAMFAGELVASPGEREALVVLFAGGTENLQAGVEKLKQLRSKQLADYMSNFESIGYDHTAALNPVLVGLTEDPLAAAMVPPGNRPEREAGPGPS
ncbi:MAG: hypothetical protein O7A71_08420 [Chloroflexi bacterium]|nr:hypothetical protein [Chloroflexota bacterium]